MGGLNRKERGYLHGSHTIVFFFLNLYQKNGTDEPQGVPRGRKDVEGCRPRDTLLLQASQAALALRGPGRERSGPHHGAGSRALRMLIGWGGRRLVLFVVAHAHLTQTASRRPHVQPFKPRRRPRGAQEAWSGEVSGLVAFLPCRPSAMDALGRPGGLWGSGLEPEAGHTGPRGV